MVPLDGPNREEHVNKLTLNHAELKKLLTAFRSEIEKITDEKITDEEKATKILNEWKDTKKSEGTYSKILKNDDKWQKLINGYKKEMDRHNELSPLAQEMLKEKYKEIAELKGKLETMSKKLETMSKKLEDAIKTRGSTPETARELKKAKTVGEVLNTLLDWIRHPTSDTNRKKRRALRMEKLTSDARGGGKPSILKNNTLRRWGPRVIKMALAAGIGIAAVATIPATHGLALVGGIIVGGMWYHYVRQDRKRKKEDRARQKNEGFENYVAGHNAENPT